SQRNAMWSSWTFVCYVVFFFFQAEDGIRDDLVTGVQTCALPISDQRPAVWREFYKATDPVESTPENEALDGYFRRIQIANQRFRSEERRVGKEGRAERGGRDTQEFRMTFCA